MHEWIELARILAAKIGHLAQRVEADVTFFWSVGSEADVTSLYFTIFVAPLSYWSLTSRRAQLSTLC